ncbi:putative ER membrane localized phosphoryltransferase [Kockovaella imperatae]|uniref:Putative ER membrane localized phosphoryltransferase n=1 Tax=Kockovaella imperatae TaxID=4999 RepID=A0A1Y1UE74_9TREE|nr:putative ER membrane localized phosphoryltransferase [Kockovaella imperatae]ORX36322.1 putative ER membrane localized phosphoryltransferase [Kockovaella imperatae]
MNMSTRSESPPGRGKATGESRAKSSSSVSPTWLRGLSRTSLAILLILYITLVHFTGLLIFTRGFLLTRLSIPNVTPPYTPESPSPIPHRHSKAIILIIDALRTDFISPYHPRPSSPNHHGVLTLPAELTASHPRHSLIFNSYSDPPTTTMQRLKGIMTGSLPTFVDAGANFASTAIEEDSLISQLVAANKKIAFMGDDTWVHLFPESFNHAHPFDSFNVEDLHTVDNGVIEHLFPYLHPSNSSQWDVLIGHFLGVDHVGHRVGPERDTMKTKLAQMDEVLRRVVKMMDDDTLLVLLGDHGMDSKGNHGGDSELETAAALWLYSKTPIFGGSIDNEFIESLPTYTYPRSPKSLRHVNQIDLLPTLSYLLGLPIPFNNLGTVIPETLGSMEDLEKATRRNALQIVDYITEYGDDKILSALMQVRQKADTAAKLLTLIESGKHRGDDTLYPTMTGMMKAKDIKIAQARHHSVVAHRKVATEALEELRALWAQFSVPLIVYGTTILGFSIPVLYAMYSGVRAGGQKWDVYLALALETAALPSVGAGVVGFIVAVTAFRADFQHGIYTFFGSMIFASEVVLAVPLLFQRPNFQVNLQTAIGPLILVIHAVSFASNSFIMWEDRVLLFLLSTIPVVNMFKSPTAPTSLMRWRTALLSLVILIVARLIGSITVCREEQQPYCRVTFFSGSTATAPTWALAAIGFVAFQLPRAVGITLNQSKSLAGPAPRFLGLTWRLSLLLSAGYWVLEWLEFYPGLVSERIPLVRTVRTWLARAIWVSIIGIMPYSWSFSPLCIRVQRDADQSGEKAVTVFGFANSYGSTYLLFLLIPFTAVHLVSYPMGQLALGGMLIILLAHLEITDTQRDAALMKLSFASSSASTFDPNADSSSSTLIRPTFTESTLLALLGLLGFFSTGHQAVLTSIQWKAAFVGFQSVTYPFSPLFVIINTWGPVALSALAVPLLGIWNISPRPQSTLPILGHVLQLVLGFMIYHTSITFTSAFFAAWLRRHLMVWKVFAPRFMLAGVTLLVVDICLLVAVAIGFRTTSWKVSKTFRCVAV